MRDKRLENRLSRYECSVPIYHRLLDEQVGCCAICGIEDPSDIDHCHTTGDVRGVLCRNCNNGLGRFHDDPELLRQAAAYLEACYTSTAELHVQRYAVNKALRRARRHRKRHAKSHGCQGGNTAKPRGTVLRAYE